MFCYVVLCCFMLLCVLYFIKGWGLKMGLFWGYCGMPCLSGFRGMILLGKQICFFWGVFMGFAGLLTGWTKRE